MTPVMYSEITTGRGNGLDFPSKTDTAQYYQKSIAATNVITNCVSGFLIKTEPNDLGDIDFYFTNHENYTLLNAHLYSNEMYERFYSDRDDRTRLGIYIELQAHYIYFKLFEQNSENPRGNPAYIGNPEYDGTAKLFEAIAQAITNPIIPVPVVPWFVGDQNE